jgi:hypothetical protein
MKKVHFIGFLALVFMINSCQLEPLPYPETFETVIEPSGLVLNKLVDGVELSNGDVIVIGTAKKDGKGDLFIARIDLNGKVVDTKIFDGGGDDEINAICKDDEEELYIVGRNATTIKGLVFKISPKNGTFTQVWLKNDVALTRGATVKQVQFLNNLVYVINGSLDGSGVVCDSTGFITLTKANALQACKGNYSRVGVLTSFVSNGKLIYGGENGSKSSLVLADCLSPKFSTSNLEFSSNFNHIRGLTANADDVFMVGNIFLPTTTGKLLAKTFLTKISWAALPSTTQFSITSANLQIDSTRNKNDYIVTSMVNAPEGVVYAASFSYVGSEVEQTQLKRFPLYNISNTSGLEDAWKAKPFLNITSVKLLNSTYKNHGGYIVIGQANQKGKVIKVNRLGTL